MRKIHNFNQSLKYSHSADNLPIWEDVYRKFFTDFNCMINHREDGWHQRMGIDRSVILNSSKQILIDEKIREQDYGDIALEYLSNAEEKKSGWVCKPLLCDYIAYAILPRGRCYLLPVIQLQNAWTANNGDWFKRYKSNTTRTMNNSKQGYYTTCFLCVDIREVYKSIRECLIADFDNGFL